MDHGRGAQHPRQRIHRTSGAPSQPEHTVWCPISGNVGQPAVSRVLLRFSPWVFKESTRSPTVVQKFFFSVLFSSILAPVLLKNSADHPDHVRVQFLFKFEFVFFTEMPLKLVLSPIRVILSLMCT